MADLWDALEGTKPVESPTLTVAIKDLDTIVVDDLITHEKIRSETDLLKTCLDCSAGIVVAAYKVADYVPNLANDQCRDFWQFKVIPALVKSLDQDVKARSIVTESFCSVRNLAISIKQGAELVKLSKGSPATVAAARRTIRAAVDDLDKSIEKAEGLKSTAIEEFAGQTEKLLMIMGPETAKYTQQKAEIENLLRLEYEKEKKLYAEIAHKKGEMEKYSHLMHVTQNQANGSLAALNETKRRTKEMMSLNEHIEKTIQNIPAAIPKTETTTNIERSAWLPWRKTTSTRITSSMTENPNRDVEKNYYESLVLSRMARIRENQDQEAAKEKVNNDLEQCLSDYKAKYESIRRELEEYEKVLPEKMAAIHREINSLNDRLIDIDKGATDATNTFGHHGNTLVQCLTEVRILAKAINNGATAYTPLVGLLKAVKVSVDAQVELLMSDDRNDIFLGGHHLLRQVGCLGHYHTYASRCMEPPQEYKTIEATNKMRVIEFSDDVHRDHQT